MAPPNPLPVALVAAAVLLGGALWLTLPATQLLLPAYAEQKVEDRLTRGGGTATASLEAVPAVRLLAGEGDEITIEGERLDLELPRRGSRVWKDLDGFDRVDVRLADFDAGPFGVSSFRLERGGSSDVYRLGMDATVSPGGFARHLGGSLGSTLSGLAGAAGAPVAEEVPIDVDLRVRSEDGKPRVVSGAGTIAGFRADLVVEAIAGSVVAAI